MNNFNNLKNKINLEKNNRGEKNPPPKKHFDFKCCKDNTIKSLYAVEHFLCNFKHFMKYIKLYKIMK